MGPSVSGSASGSAFICAQVYSLPVSITQQTGIQRIFSICHIAVLQLIFPGLRLFLTVHKFCYYEYTLDISKIPYLIYNIHRLSGNNAAFIDYIKKL